MAPPGCIYFYIRIRLNISELGREAVIYCHSVTTIYEAQIFVIFPSLSILAFEKKNEYMKIKHNRIDNWYWI